VFACPVASCSPMGHCAVGSPVRKLRRCRATRATELGDAYPSHVAAAWLGHSERIADRHYRHTTGAHYARAITEPTGAMPGQSERLAQKPAQSPHVSVNQGSPRHQKTPENPGLDEGWSPARTPPMEDRGLEPLTFWLPARGNRIFWRYPLFPADRWALTIPGPIANLGLTVLCQH